MKNRLGRIAIVLGALGILTATAFLADHAAPQDNKPLRVLFIGNSYTYFNNLPEIFAGLAKAGGRAVETRMEAPGGWRLKDHWEKGEARKALLDGKWDFVVLQDQSTLGVNYYFEGRPRVTSVEVFKPYAEKWVAAIHETGATPVFYLTWARKATPEDQAALNYAYMTAARETKAVVAPVGIAWRIALEQSPAPDLYYRDGSHPSASGSYLAACTLYSVILKRNPDGLPGRIEGQPVNLDTEKVESGKNAVLVDIPPAEAKVLQSAAWQAWRQLSAKGGTFDVAPVQAPAAVLPAGVILDGSALAGTWTGEVLFFPSGRADMTLALRRDGAEWKGRLEIAYHSKDLKDESIEITDFRVGERELTFSDPKSPGASNIKVSFRGVCVGAGEMSGVAEAVLVRPDSTVRLLGTWRLNRKAG